MLNQPNTDNTLVSFLDIKPLSEDQKQIVINRSVQTDSPSILQIYDNYTSAALNSVDDTLDQQAIDQEAFKNNVKTTYKKIKQEFNKVADTISSGLNTSKYVVLYGVPVVLAILAWKLIGKDIYEIAKAK